MKIGFLDYSLNNYHANKFHMLLTGKVGAGEVQLVAAHETNPTGDDWCAAKGVPRASSAQEVVDKSDAIIVLAPDNSSRHLELGQIAYKSGKPVFVDKYLATTTEDAKEIVRLAAASKSPLMSSSSLRYSVELEELVSRIGNEPILALFSRGIGKWGGYACHSVAPALRLLGTRIKRVIDTGSGNVHLVTLDDGNRHSSIELRESENQMEATPWQVGVLIGKNYDVVTISKYDEFYENLMKETVKFFKSGKSPISTEEMLETVAIEVAATESAAKGGVWVDVRI